MIQLESIINATNIYLSAKNKDLKYIYCNDAVSHAIGLGESKNIIGKSDYELFDVPRAKTYRQGDMHILNGGTYCHIKETHPRNGQIINILTTKNLLKNKKGEFNGVVVSCIEIPNDVYTISNEFLPYDAAQGIYRFIIDGQEDYFTQREYETFKHLIFGLTAKQIASKLGISYRTVQVYTLAIVKKLQCSSKFFIVEAALRYGIIFQNIFTHL